ncbi:C40 family peptidase [Paramaledivibacter caminithermalis]|jgi:uncharacterized protein YgiM (DUF1202 family)|uniref:Cell wall-associated hydrolase, NlpC family n=1 Tax=Paramaledivibacter caminithermalis (strain DSM 15212 / CIP 107654 / DViRD3) TaxID=1121301 RepID=A0A1M6NBU0_PARC5|nr:C40 family peptidase [Paramaledivibacter caminithermalis]SHJ93127.1 Cell wall-associated hydrolase, NlpC family [Paramaledivibacter caminithermalis DSM 15212]
MKYKKTFITLSLSLGCIVFTPFAAFGEGQAQGVILGDNVNIRQEPKIDSKVLTNLDIGEEVDVLSNDSNWYLIETDSDTKGWILNDLIAVDEEKDFIKKGIVNADTLNVRKEPSTDSDIIGNLPQKSEVTIVHIQDDWYQIAINKEKKGWIHRDYVDIRPNYSKGIIIGDNVNLRKEKSIDSEILDTLNLEAYVYIRNFSDGWYNILTFKGVEGWVHKDYVNVIFGGDSRNTVSRSANRLSLKIVQEGKKYLGVPYKYGADGPNKFDCSGFTSYVFKKCGIKLPRTSREQAKVGKKVSKSDLQAGDLVFFNRNGKGTYITHVGIYIGNGQFIHASSGSKYSVIISDITTGSYNKRYVTARRVF